jgi:DNA-binding LacI/PurR family transcriptional regulator
MIFSMSRAGETSMVSPGGWMSIWAGESVRVKDDHRATGPVAPSRPEGAASSRRRSYGRVTLKDIALDLDISLATVARAFQKDAVISEETRQLVLRRAEDLGYRANAFARSLATSKTRIVGVIMSSVNSPIYAEVLAKLSERIHRIDMSLMLIPGSFSQDFDASLQTLMAYNPDVILVFSGLLSDKAIDQTKVAGIPLIYFNRLSRDPDAYGVGCYNDRGGALVADFLIDSGHKHLAFLSAGNDATTNVERMTGFVEQAKARGRPSPKIISAGGFSYEDGLNAAQAAKAILKKIDGIFCASDLLALGFADGVKKNFGIVIPEDLSVVGCQNISIARWSSHGLTTLCLPIDEMVDRTIAMLASLSRGEPVDPRVIRVPPEGIIARGTTKPKAGGLPAAATLNRPAAGSPARRRPAPGS